MKIIISPAKKMNINTDDIEVNTTPIYIKETEKLKIFLKTLNYPELKKLLACNDKIAELNYDRYQDMDLERSLTPALLSYEGIQYQYMAPHVFSESQWNYVQDKLRILSGFYGIVKPLDGIVPYRLEMQAKLKTDFCKSLYDFWGDKLYKDLVHNEDFILSLASKEYSKTIESYLTENIKYITCTFGTFLDGKVKVKATEAKMARGEMVRYLSENNISDIERIKKFNRLDFKFNNELSSESELVFVKQDIKK